MSEGSKPGEASENWADEMTATIALMARSRYPHERTQRFAYFNRECEALSERIWNPARAARRSGLLIT
jgi:hypothetical protein